MVLTWIYFAIQLTAAEGKLKLRHKVCRTDHIAVQRPHRAPERSETDLRWAHIILMICASLKLSPVWLDEQMQL